MTFISHEQAQRFAKWRKEHPEEYEEFTRFHQQLFEELMAKKMTIQEFIRKHEEFWEKKEKHK